MPRYIGENVPSNILDFFELKEDRVYWREAPPAERPKDFRNKKMAPWGYPAGGREVFGRGNLVSCSGTRLLTPDLKFALEHAGEWPWQFGPADQPKNATPHSAAAHDHARGIVEARFGLSDDNIIWKQDRGYTPDGSPQYPAGSRVLGFALSGFRGPLISTSGYGFLAEDIRAVLRTGQFPF